MTHVQLLSLASDLEQHRPLYIAIGSAERGLISTWGVPEALGSRYVVDEVFGSREAIESVHASIARQPDTHLPQMSGHGSTLGLLFPFEGVRVLGVFLEADDVIEFMRSGYEEIKAAVQAHDFSALK